MSEMSSIKAGDESPERPSSMTRKQSFSSMRSRIRKSSFLSKRRSGNHDGDSPPALEDSPRSKRLSVNSERALPPVPPLPPRPTIITTAPPLPARPLAPAQEPLDLASSPPSLGVTAGSNEGYEVSSPAPALDLPPAITVQDGHDSSDKAHVAQPHSNRDAKAAAGGVTGGLADTARGIVHLLGSRPAAQPDAGPFQQQIPMIMTFFGVTCAAVLVLSRVHWLVATVLAVCSSHVLWKKLDAAGRDAQWEVEMAEAAKRFKDPAKREETVEWLNSTLATVWPLIGSDYFVPFVDLLEDSLMTQVPGIVHSVRVEDLDQGTIPIRVKGFKLLPSDEASFLAPESESTGKSKRNSHLSTNSATSAKDAGLAGATTSSEDDDDSTGIDTGDYVNLEVTFAYRGTKPSRRKKGTTTTNNAGDSSEPIGADAEADPGYQTVLEAPTEKIHMLIYMGIGLQKIAAVEVPVWVEMVGIEGRMRVRLQLTPVAPFVKHVALTFVGTPKLEMSAKPLGKKMIIDAMNLPLISSYALHSIEDVIKGFIAPKSYTVDVAGLLGSGEGPQDVYAMGLIVVVFHQASNLAASDSNGFSDPFVQVSFSHAGRPMFTSRVLRKTTEPIWQETAFILVTPDELRDHERLRLTVFDADRFSADDPLGKVEVSIDGLIRRASMRNQAASNLFETRLEDLKPLRRGTPVQGQLKFSVAFAPLAQGKGTNLSGKRQELLRRAEMRAKQSRDAKRDPHSLDFAERSATAASPPPLPPKAGQSGRAQSVGGNADGNASGLAEAASSASTGDSPGSEVDEELQRFMTPFDRFVHKLGLPMDDTVLAKRRDRRERVDKLIAMIEGAKSATTEKPQRELPTGIVAFHIHSIHNLEVQQTQRSYSNSKRLSQKQRYTTNAEETLAEGTGAGKLPSSYVQVLLNDEAIFRTRTKTLNARPFINGGSERYVGDWTTARIDFTVRDARMREGDPILGCVGLRLSDVFKSSSRSTEWYTLTGGLGFGKIRITLVWRSFKIDIPKPLRGWNIGVLELGSCRVTGLSPQTFEAKPCHVLIETVGGKSETANVEPVNDESAGAGDLAKLSYQWPLDETPVRIPVRQRYPNFIYIHLRSESRMPGRHHKHARAVIPLNRIADDTFTHRRVPLYETSDIDQFEQDMMRAMANSDQLLSPIPGDEERVRLSAALEEVCASGSRELPAEVALTHHIKCIGWLELDFIYHRGLGPEHGSNTAGDHELRFAYDTYVTLTDCGERPKSHSLNSESRRRFSQLCAQQQSIAELPGGEVGDPSSSSKRPTHRRILSQPRAVPAGAFVAEPEQRPSMEAVDDQDDDQRSLYTASVTDSELEDYMEDDDPNTPEGRRARQRAMHRQHRGAAQVKGFRTLSWLKTNAEDGAARVKRQFGKQNKRTTKMESEGVSHF